jgi:hypothetical protein
MNSEKELNEKHSIHSVVDQAIRGALQMGYVQSSKESSLEIKSLKDNHNKIMEKMDKFEEKMEDMRIKIAEIPEKLAEKFDERYASKNSERIIYGMAGAFLLGIVYAILKMLIK